MTSHLVPDHLDERAGTVNGALASTVLHDAPAVGLNRRPDPVRAAAAVPGFESGAWGTCAGR